MDNEGLIRTRAIELLPLFLSISKYQNYIEGEFTSKTGLIQFKLFFLSISNYFLKSTSLFIYLFIFLVNRRKQYLY